MKIVEDFTDKQEFFKWYFAEVKKYVPNYKALAKSNNSKVIAEKLPHLGSDYRDFMFRRVREIINFPDNITLVFKSNFHTWASTANTLKKRIEIWLPPYAQWQIYYPPIIKAGIQHEMGHILNRDLEVDMKGLKRDGVNICQDCRINANIDEEDMDSLHASTYRFEMKEEPTDLIIPKYFYPKGLKIPFRGRVYGWRQTYDFWKRQASKSDDDGEPKKKPKKYFEQPKVGDIVQVRSGDNEGDLGVVTAVDSAGNCTVKPMTIEEVEQHFKEMQGGSYTGIK